MGRRAVPGHVRPKYEELEALCRAKAAGAEAAAA
jgi:hypothetical protein